MEKWLRIARNKDKSPWEERNEVVTKYIKKNSSVLDIGAGNMEIKNILPEGCSYQPMDCVKSCDATIFVDFNKKIIPELDRKYDISVCSGIMEYINEPEDFLISIKDWSEKIILTYAIKEKRTEAQSRKWNNNLSLEDLDTLFKKAGFSAINVDTWRRQNIFILKHGLGSL